MKEAKIFVCHHPDSLILYKNLAKIVRTYNKESKILLFKINHPYFLKFDFEPYKKYFNEVIEFDFIHYKKNFLKGYWEILNFKKKLKKVENNLLTNFEKMDLFLENSAWLPVNFLFYNLSKNKNVNNIVRLTYEEADNPQIKKDNFRTFLCRLYGLPFKSYKIKAMKTLAGKFADFVYNENIPGKLVKIVNPASQKENKENTLPYPIIINNEGISISEKNMIIIFGDENIFHCYSEYLPDYQAYLNKLNDFFRAIENKYSDCELYYKSHPSDRKNQIMLGIDIKKYKLFDNTVNAQILLENYHQKIRAVYSFSSSSVAFASFFGIPSYTFYRYVFNTAGIERFDRIYKGPNRFLYHISNLSDIGRIDNLGRKPEALDLNNIDNCYKKVLNI